MIFELLLPLTLFFIMLSLGLGLKVEDFLNIVKFPKAFGIGVLNQAFLLPLLAIGIVILVRPEPELALGIMILALCPGGVISNILTRLANGNVALSIALTAIMSLISVITLPICVGLSAHYLIGVDGLRVDVSRLGIQMALITAIPVGIGILLTRFAPRFVEEIRFGVSRLSMVLFVLLVLAALIDNWEVFSINFGDLGPALILLNASLLFLGLMTCRLFSLGTKDATTIAIESGIQNGTLAIAVGALIAPTGDTVLPPVTVPAAVYGISMYFVSLPFVWWRRRLA